MYLCIYVYAHTYVYSYVDAYMCVPSLIYMRNMQVLSYLNCALYICTHICVFTYWRIHVCAMTHIYAWHDPCRFYRTSIAPYIYAHIYVYLLIDAYMCAPWLIYTCDMTRAGFIIPPSRPSHDFSHWQVSIYVLWILPHVWHDSCTCVTRLIHHVTWLIHHIFIYVLYEFYPYMC